MGLSYENYDYAWAWYDNPNLFQSYKSVDEQYYTSAAVSWTPANWLTLSFNSQYGSHTQNWSYTNPAGYFPAKSSDGYAYRQTLVANVNLMDTGPGAQRFVLNTFLGGYIVPAHDGYDTEPAIYGGLTANYQWRLGQSGFSIDALGQLEVAGISPNANVVVYPDARLLLSYDKLGIAIGPVFDTAQWVSSSQAVSSQSTYYSAGGAVIFQPFRSSQSLLNGVILQTSAVHSIGPANWVPTDEAKTSQLDVTTSIAFNFHY
ncbi:MAG: hypothetical protein ACLPPF_07655 [Rhodomicrobium sp.]